MTRRDQSGRMFAVLFVGVVTALMLLFVGAALVARLRWVLLTVAGMAATLPLAGVATLLW